MIETTSANDDSCPAAVGRDRASVDTELAGKLLHRPTGPVAGSQHLDLGGLQGPSSPRPAPWNQHFATGFLWHAVPMHTDIQVSELAQGRLRV